MKLWERRAGRHQTQRNGEENGSHLASVRAGHAAIPITSRSYASLPHINQNNPEVFESLNIEFNFFKCL
jgi:hypothetical protein